MKRDYYCRWPDDVDRARRGPVEGSNYHVGTLVRMGPGFFPVALGVILVVMGMLIAGASLASAEGGDERILPEHPQWFGWLCILAGPVMFMILGVYGGMIPAVFACVFVCALGDRTTTR